MRTKKQSATPQLTGKNGGKVSLKSVHMEGHLNGLLLSMKSRQHYRNSGEENIEAVYTFPLPWGATLLGLNAEVDGRRLEGKVMEKKKAASRYEDAIEDGDMPIMVERSARGLFTANLGNLKPGESAIIEIEYAQLLNFEQGQIRITIPTTVAARYGDGHETNELATHQSVETSLLAEYSFTLSLAISGELAKATLNCPTHDVTHSKEVDRTLITLNQHAYLDRDFVLLLEGLKGQSVATCASDGDHYVALASFCPDVQNRTKEPLFLKVLVDCSGSMGGESISSARSALHEVLKELEPQDQISYSRFGSEVVHDTKTMMACTSSTIKAISGLVSRTDADLGGTELNEALLSTFRMGVVNASGESIQFDAAGLTADVLLITDGALWGIEEMVGSAQSSGHRIFAIGVGSAPAESLLRELAAKTGGACELVSPNQELAAVVLRMVNRMRAPKCDSLVVDWGQQPIWQSYVPMSLFEEETLHVYAQLPKKPSRKPTLSYRVGQAMTEVSAIKPVVTTNAVVARMMGAVQFEEAALPPEDNPNDLETHAQKKLEIALQHQLVTDVTNLILVHVREGEKKAVGLPKLEQIAQMHAAGWGGVGRSNERVPTLNTLAGGAVFGVRSSGFDNFDSSALGALFGTPRFLLKETSPPAATKKKVDVLNSSDLQRKATFVPVKPIVILESFESAVMDSRMVGSAFITEYLAKFPIELILLVNEMVEHLKSRNQAMALLIQWLSDDLPGQSVLSGQARRILRHSLRNISEEAMAMMKAKLTKECGIPSLNSWLSNQESRMAEKEGDGNS